MVDIEDGYTKIANELLEAIIAYPFSKRQLKIVFTIIRKTYGYNKKMDDITMTQIAEMTRLHLPHVSTDVTELVTRKVLFKTPGRYGYMLGLNKKYTEWLNELPKQSLKRVTETVSQVTKTVTPSYQNGNHELPKQSPRVTETVNTKETSKRKPQKKYKTLQGESKNSPCEKPTNGTWKSYSTAYYVRYRVEPKRNGTINGQLSQFVKRIGKDDAPHVAAFYVRHNSRWYVQKGHAIGVMLTDAEKLYAEWKRNEAVTETQARQIDKTQTNANVFEKLIREAEDNGK